MLVWRTIIFNKTLKQVKIKEKVTKKEIHQRMKMNPIMKKEIPVMIKKLRSFCNKWKANKKLRRISGNQLSKKIHNFLNK